MLAFRWAIAPLLPFTASLLLACGGASPADTSGTTSGTSAGAGGSGGEGGGGVGGGDPFTPAPHPAAPQVVNLGGEVLATPKVVTISYDIDPHRAGIEAAVNEMASSPFWPETTAEYGVGPLTVLPPIHRSELPPKSLTDEALVQSLVQNLGGADPAWGAADASTIYLFIIPSGTALDAGGFCCESFDGYHADAKIGTTRVPYAVACSCPGFDGPKVSDLQQLSVVTSHELVEAATDPFLKPAYLQTDDDHIVWTVMTGGETSDLCTLERDAYYVQPGTTTMIQRSWSNKAAAEGHDPCVPRDDVPYFNSAPLLDDTITIDNFGPVQTRGVKLAVGQTKTIDVALFSDAPTEGPWKVEAFDVNGDFFGGKKLLNLSLDKDQGQNGDVLRLTIEVLAYDNQLDGAAFVLASTQGDQENLWFGVVGQ
jgi:hypothetical protein